MLDFASLGIKVATDGVASGTAELDELAASAQRAENAAQGVGPAYSAAGQQVQAGTAAVKASAAGFGTQATQMRAAGLSAAQYANAMRMLPAQITDIVTGLASGQAPFMVAIQQGGQLRDSFGGFGNTLRALGTVITPARLLVGGLGLAAYTVARAYHEAQKEGFELNKQIILSGNAAGVTAGQLALMAENIDALVGTRGAAAAAIGEIAASGKVAAEDLQEFGIAAQYIARNLEQPVEETVKILTALRNEPVDAVVKLNEKTNFLTKSVYDQIVALQRRGDIEEAGALAQRTYLEEFQRRALLIEGKMPAISAATRGAADAVKELGDGLTGLFIAPELEQELRDLREARGDRELFSGRAAFVGRQRAADLREVELTRQIEQARADAEKRAADAREIAAAQRLPAEISAAVARERTISEAVASARAVDIQRELQDSLAQYSAYEIQLEAQRDAGLISLEDYYDERRKLIEQNRDAQVEALEAENRLLEEERARIQENARREIEATTTAEARKKVEAQTQAALIENQARILENESAIARVTQEAIAAGNVLNTEHKKATDAATRGFNEAKRAAEEYLAVLERQNQRKLDVFGLGDRAREIIDARNEIDDRFAQQRLDLDRDRAADKITKEAYEQRLQLIEESNQRALKANEEYYGKLAELEGDFYLGARQAFSNYIDSARNVAEQSAEVFTSAFEGMENALVDFVTTGKADFASLAESIIADLLRIQLRAAAAQIFSSIGGGLSGLLGSGTSVQATAAASGADFFGPRAAGGPVEAGRSYLVGEKGPELIVPRNPGVVIPNNKIGGPSVTIHQTLYAAPGTNVAQFQSMLEQSKAEVKNEILEGLSRGRYAGVAG